MDISPACLPVLTPLPIHIDPIDPSDIDDPLLISRLPPLDSIDTLDEAVNDIEDPSSISNPDIIIIDPPPRPSIDIPSPPVSDIDPALLSFIDVSDVVLDCDDSTDPADIDMSPDIPDMVSPVPIIIDPDTVDCDT
jgi:hypothetical protein